MNTDTLLWLLYASCTLSVVASLWIVKLTGDKQLLTHLITCQKHELDYRRAEMRLQKFLQSGELEDTHDNG